METILITGFNGFIGTHLIPALTLKYSLIGLTNSNNSKIRIPYIKKNITTINEKSFPEKISTIIHLAAVSDVDYCQKNPTTTTSVNILGTQRILELARKKDANVIFLSTSHVYGKPTKIPIQENDTKNPQSLYAATKLSGEILCKSYSDSYGLNIAVVRLFSIYGPSGPKHSLISKIINQMITKKSIELGNISSKRDFVFINDVISAIHLILKKHNGYDEYNIGSGTSYSINHICEILNRISRKKIPVISNQKKFRKNDVPEIVSNSKKICSLGWTPKVSLNSGLKITYNWYLKNLKG